jgi:hypothetical protein
MFRFINRVKRFTQKRRLLHRIQTTERQLIDRIRAENLTYLSRTKLAGIVLTLQELESNDLSGAIVEAGCALGGSTILISKLKSSARELKVYDVFGMIPAPTEEDDEEVHQRYQTIVDKASVGIGGNPYYGYEENLKQKVKDNLERFGVDLSQDNVQLIEGLVQDTLHLTSPVLFAHIDVDWYDPVKTCLNRIWPHLIVGGALIIDDYHDWGGCRKATDEFLGNHRGQYQLDDTYGSLKITKLATD